MDDGAAEVHEQEVGHKVFGRPPEYDTASDNIVRVHASTLRKRLEQYFASEGRDEPVTIELPKGNYAPVFRERDPAVALSREPVIRAPRRAADWKLWFLGALVLVFAASTLFLLSRTSRTNDAGSPGALWSQVFERGKQTDIVLDDASLALYQELSGQTISLSNYFDRDYLRSVPDKSKINLILKRNTSYAGAGLLWKLSPMAAAQGAKGAVQFAREFSFHALKNDNAILLGTTRSNPWIEPFEAHLGLRWQYDAGKGIYLPFDTRSASQPSSDASRESGEVYAMAALLPNLGGTGAVLILSATGGSATNAAGEFLTDSASLSQLRSMLPSKPGGAFPWFEALLRVKNRGSMPRQASIVVCRELRP